MPQDRQDALNAFPWASVCEEIAKAQELNESQTNDLQAETLLVFIGLADFDEYQKQLEEDLVLSPEKAEEITNQAIDKIFIPVMASIPSAVNAMDITQTREFNGVFTKLETSATAELARKIRSEIHNTVLANQNVGQRDFLKDLGNVVKESTKGKE